MDGVIALSVPKKTASSPCPLLPAERRGEKKNKKAPSPSRERGLGVRPDASKIF